MLPNALTIVYVRLLQLGDTTEVACDNALTVIMQIVNENLCSVPIKNAVELAGNQKELSLLASVLAPLINRQPMMNVCPMY
jgi:hypothetical protein